MKKETATSDTALTSAARHSGAMVAVSLGGTRRARLQIDGDQRQKQGEKIGEIMSGLGEQRQRMGTNPGHHQQHDVGKSHAQRNFQYSLGTAPAMNVDVHHLSVRAGKAGFKTSGDTVKRSAVE